MTPNDEITTCKLPIKHMHLCICDTTPQTSDIAALNYRLRDIPLDICLQTFLLLSRKNCLFFGDQRPTISFYVSSKKLNFFFFVVCFPYYVRYYLVFFSGKHIFHQLRQQTIFSCPHFQQTFFLTFVRQSIFFNFFLASFPPPSPDIKWCVPNLHIPDQLEKVSLLSMCHNTANMHSY